MTKRRCSRSPSPRRSKIIAKDQAKSPLPFDSNIDFDCDESALAESLSSSSPFVKRDDSKNIVTETSESQENNNKKPSSINALTRDRQWINFRRENLSLDYTILYNRKKASELISRCESEFVYNVGNLAQVRMFGKWIDIPRKQVAFGDVGLTYTFSGNTVPANPWTPLLLEMKNDISKKCGLDFNFVLINRYQDGNHYMGEHKDDEKDLCPNHPIASLSLGQQRDFIFKHQDSRGKNAKRKIDKLTIQLESGSLLLMNAPTNSFCYQDGNHYMGEHKDDEKDLCPNHPIASLSLGQQRDFIFKHQDSRGKNAKRKIDKLTIQLESGSLLLMNAPTNSFWYHCLPKRPKVLGMRLNFTFRKMVPSKCKPVQSAEGCGVKVNLL